ncbi:type VII secretion protein EccB [Streptomyces sp. LBL]|uniref:type VII secretion protein EccB n=1 Tax=Streptomyces sp. LBL TaxID=2940562 RepID=UPI00247725EC|nr:type VII secretion protein EccB [Streptomyces sp. LBL]MDH6630473.1 type VII secretion protein EccB [Streptomyces sp. LBL]
MQNRRDHLHAYQFATGRLATALVSGDPGGGEIPMRRAALGSMFGIVIALLLVIAALVYGLIKPVENPDAWKKAGALVVEKETGTRYLYVGGTLHPTANYSSTLLALGSSGSPSVENVSRDKLADVRRGSPFGILGAPEDVAPSSSLLTGSWADCLHPGSAGQVLDFAPDSARRAAKDSRILVSGPGDTRYVLWQNRKYAIEGRSSLIALGLDTEPPVKATAAWLAALPTGETIAPAAIPGTGTGAGPVAGASAQVGQLYRMEVSGAGHYYVLRQDGLAPLTATESALLAAAPGGKQPRKVSANDIATAKESSDSSLMHRLPDLLSGTDATTDGGSALCLRRADDGSEPDTTVVVREAGRAAAAGSRTLVPPGHAVLAAPPKERGAYNTPDPYLITDQGVKYQLVGKAAGALGYSGVTPRVLPLAILDRIPTGPSLSTAKAVGAVRGGN